MNRRDLMKAGVIPALTFVGCGSGKRRYAIKPHPAPYSFKVTEPKPHGTMPMCEIGTTGIRVSQLCFGSHIRQELREYVDERRKIIREAYDLGMNFYDVYDLDGNCHQYEPMGKHLAPVINDVVISVSYHAPEGFTPDQELARILRLFGRDHIDLIRVHRDPGDPLWETFFRWKEKGYVRAVGKGIHDLNHLDGFLDKLPLDFVMFPYNFYHNRAWFGEQPDDFDPLPPKLRSKGIGVLTMKPFAGEHLVDPFNQLARKIAGKDGPDFPRASLRYTLNAGFGIDSVMAGMYCLDEVYRNTDAFYSPEMSVEERGLLTKLRKIADSSASAWLPDHYRFLERWAV